MHVCVSVCVCVCVCVHACVNGCVTLSVCVCVWPVSVCASAYICVLSLLLWGGGEGRTIFNIFKSNTFPWQICVPFPEERHLTL